MIPHKILIKKLEELKLPSNVKKKIIDINDLKVQGARNVAIASLQIIKELIEKNYKNIDKVIKLLQDLRKTQVITYNVLEIVKNNKSLETINKIIQYLEDSKQKINKTFLNSLLSLGKSKIKIITHCHSSEEISALTFAKEYGLDITVYVTETRPKYQGVKTAKELVKAGLKVKYIVDSAAGFYMPKADLVIFGTDAIRREGIINKIGTFMISLAARYYNKQVWFVGDILKLDLRKELYIEMRNPEEIIDPAFLPNVEILNPAFDLTPWELIDKVITNGFIGHGFDDLYKFYSREIKRLL